MFTVYIAKYGQEPVAVSAPTTPKQAIKILGSHISGKRAVRNLQEAYAIGSRFGWRYSQSQLRALVS